MGGPTQLHHHSPLPETILCSEAIGCSFSIAVTDLEFPSLLCSRGCCFHKCYPDGGAHLGCFCPPVVNASMPRVWRQNCCCTRPSNEPPSYQRISGSGGGVGNDKDDTPNWCYKKQPPLLNTNHLILTRAPAPAYCYRSLPGYLRRSRVNNAFFVSFLITRCQIFKARPVLPDR